MYVYIHSHYLCSTALPRNPIIIHCSKRKGKKQILPPGAYSVIWSKNMLLPGTQLLSVFSISSNLCLEIKIQ